MNEGPTDKDFSSSHARPEGRRSRLLRYVLSEAPVINNGPSD